MKSLVLTGCGGFIGYNFLKRFVDSGRVNDYKMVVSIDKMGYATLYNRENYEEIFLENDNMIGICANIVSLNSYAVEKWLPKGTIVDVLDFASESHVDNSIDAPAEIFAENSLIPVILLQVLKDVEIDTYWHISTDEVYGDLPLDVSPEDWFDINHQYKPSNPYSASKVAQDAYLAAQAHTFGLNVKFIRMANQFGPNQHKEKMIPASILRALNGETIKVYGEGKNIRQWTYVEDTVKLIDNLLQHGTNDYITHLADPKNLFDNNFIANKIAESLKRHDVNAEIEYIKDRPGHDRAYALKVPMTVASSYTESFNESLDRTVDFYVEGFKDGKFS
jgi:dTDP-glucose 4,6-dehydratase